MNLKSIQGELLGAGAYSRVYAHKNDSSKAIMCGNFSDDVCKLALYGAIGALFGVYVDLDGGYFAIIERMQNSSEVSAELDETSNSVDSALCGRIDRWRAVLDLATSPDVQERSALIFEFVYSKQWAFGADFGPRNFLMDYNGNVLCMDGFNFRKLSAPEAESVAAEIGAVYI